MRANTSDHLLVTDQLWNAVHPLLPQRPGQPRSLDDRAVLEGILFVLHHGIAWYELPRDMGCGCGMTCWRRLRMWHAAGVWEKLQPILLEHLPQHPFTFSRIVHATRSDWNRHATAARRRRRMRRPFPDAFTTPAPSHTGRQVPIAT